MKETDRILNGENVRMVLTGDYHIVMDPEGELLEMSKLTSVYADQEITGPIPEFIYFSQEQDSHGPRIKFPGGTKETSKTRTAPSFEFGVNGPIRVNIQPWMDKKNCPNVFNRDCLDKVGAFIKNHLALLLLTWFYLVDESDVLHYFEGDLQFKDLLDKIDVQDEQKDKILQCKDEKELYQICKDLDLYKF